MLSNGQVCQPIILYGGTVEEQKYEILGRTLGRTCDCRGVGTGEWEQGVTRILKARKQAVRGAPPNFKLINYS